MLYRRSKLEFRSRTLLPSLIPYRLSRFVYVYDLYEFFLLIVAETFDSQPLSVATSSAASATVFAFVNGVFALNRPPSYFASLVVTRVARDGVLQQALRLPTGRTYNK